MGIRELCYELYKIDWKHSHGITMDIEMDALKNYFVEDNGSLMYSEYLEEVGYNGMLYVCFDEFCNEEYRNILYICRLLDNEDLILQYYIDVGYEEE